MGYVIRNHTGRKKKGAKIKAMLLALNVMLLAVEVMLLPPKSNASAEGRD